METRNSGLVLSRDRLERWAAKPKEPLFGLDQDEDLALMAVLETNPEHLPLVIEFLDRSDIPTSKRTLLLATLVEMLLLERSPDFVTDSIARTLGRAIVRNADVAQVALQDIGLEGQVMVRKLLELPLPEGLPQGVKNIEPPNQAL
mgnify:CR=1 FL=1